MLSGVIMVAASVIRFYRRQGRAGDRSHVALRRILGFGDRPLSDWPSPRLIVLYASLGRVDYVLITSITMGVRDDTSYTRARAESSSRNARSFMERPERIVLFMIAPSRIAWPP